MIEDCRASRILPCSRPGLSEQMPSLRVPRPLQAAPRAGALEVGREERGAGSEDY